MKAIYRRAEDEREFGQDIYRSNFLDLAYSASSLQEAKKRIVSTATGMRYTPSKEYVEAKRKYDLERLKVRKQH